MTHRTEAWTHNWCKSGKVTYLILERHHERVIHRRFHHLPSSRALHDTTPAPLAHIVTMAIPANPATGTAHCLCILARKCIRLERKAQRTTGCAKAQGTSGNGTLGFSSATIVGNEGPCTSASKMPTLPPRRAMAYAKFTDTCCLLLHFVAARALQHLKHTLREREGSGAGASVKQYRGFANTSFGA